MKKSPILLGRNRRAGILRYAILTVAVCLAASNPAFAQWLQKQTGCYADSITANPNRPTVANPADITQYGVLELEYGWDQPWKNEGSQPRTLAGLLKFGLLCDVELRWGTTTYQWQTSSGITSSGTGDNWLGPQIRFYRQTSRVPSMAFSYSVKIPTANAQNGLGTGRVDQAFTLLASKDIAHFHFDFNATQFLIGVPNASGIDQNQQIDLAFSHVIYGKLQGTGEFYADNHRNPTTPGYTSTLWALSYTIAPRLVVDGGFEAGFTSGAPHLHEFLGATYSLGNLYPGWRRKRSRRRADH
jgi:hypothetical protein